MSRGADYLPFLGIAMAVVVIVPLFVFPGFLLTWPHCNSSYNPSVTIGGQRFCAETVPLPPPAPCGPNLTGGVGPTTDTSFFGFGFAANLTQCCIFLCPNIFPVLQGHVSEPNVSSCAFLSHWSPPGSVPENWTIPDGAAGWQWLTKYNLTLLVAPSSPG